MPRLEDKISGILLQLLRARRGSMLARRAVQDSPKSTRSSQPKVTQREVRFSDRETVNTLKMNYGLTPDSKENWHRLWRDNPVLVSGHGTPCMGWIMEAEETVVGYLGNIPLLYHYGDTRLRTVVGSGFVVEPAYRGLSLCLIASFYRQKDVDLFLSTTAIESVGKMALACHATTLPQKDYENVLFWVMDPYHFVDAVMSTIDVQSGFRKLGSSLGQALLKADIAIRKRWPKGVANCLSIKEMAISRVGEEMQAFWCKKLAERPRLLADRSPAQLRWHFDIPGSNRTNRVLCCYSGGQLVGYAIVSSKWERDIDLRRSIIADLLVLGEDPRITSQLLIAAYEHAKAEKNHVLEVMGFPSAVRDICSNWQPYARRYPACPFHFKASNRALHEELIDERAWHACPFDGDSTLVR